MVLDVGSGGNPFPRSDVLLDRLTGDDHRCGEAMMIDRACVFGDAASMPFKDNAFDFVIASHILEHMPEPEVFIKELQRVGKAGYIETPNALMERFHPYNIHCLELLNINGILHINKKAKPVIDQYLGTKNLLGEKSEFGQIMFKHPKLFHIEYLWDKSIEYKIHNSEVSCDWIEEINDMNIQGEHKESFTDDIVQGAGWREYGMLFVNAWHSYKRKKRLKNFDLISILACPSCHADLEKNNNKLHCNSCNKTFSYEGEIPNFN